MAALMNQWANEAAIVLVYWNTLRRIGDFCGMSANAARLSYQGYRKRSQSKERNGDLYLLKHDSLLYKSHMKLCYLYWERRK